MIVNPRVAHYLQNERRRELVKLEDANQKRILVTAREDFGPEKVEMKIVREEAPQPTAPPARELVIPPEVKAGVQEKGRQDQQQRQEQQQRQGQPGHRGRRRRGRRGRGGRYQQQQVQPQAPPTPQQGPPAEKKTLPPEPSEPEKPEGPPPERVEPERDREPQTSSGQD